MRGIEPTMKPETLNYDHAAKLFPALDPLSAAASVFLEVEDYWQDSNQFVGPMPAPGDSEGLKYLKKSFVAFPKLGELVHRHVAGIVGREPAFEVVTDASERAAAAEAGGNPKALPDPLKVEMDAAMGDWWDRERLHEVVRVFASYLAATTKAYLRYNIPPGLLQDAQDAQGNLVSVVDAATWQEALELIYVEVLKPGQATVYVDPSTRQRISVFKYQEESPSSTADKKQMRDCIELSWVVTRDDAGRRLDTPITVVRIVRSDKTESQVELDNGGKMMLVEAAIHPIVFRPVVSAANLTLQNALNAVATMVKVNADVAGFPEKNLVDLEPPTEEKANPLTGQLENVETELITGPRTAAFLMSTTDVRPGQQGEDAFRAPRQGTIIYRAPVSSSPLRDDAQFFERGLYQNARQAHVLNDIAGDASGIARVEARADFANSLLDTAPIVEGALRHLLRGVRCLAAYLAQDSRLEEFKAARENVTCHVSSGPLSPDERAEIVARYAAHLVSRETAMAMLGTDDIDAEVEKIRQDMVEQATIAISGGDGSFDPMAGLNSPPGTTDPAAPGTPGAPDAGVVTTQALNGAQVTAVLAVLDAIASGRTPVSVGVEILVSVGIERARAQQMADQTQKTGKPAVGA